LYISLIVSVVLTLFGTGVFAEVNQVALPLRSSRQPISLPVANSPSSPAPLAMPQSAPKGDLSPNVPEGAKPETMGKTSPVTAAAPEKSEVSPLEKILSQGEKGADKSTPQPYQSQLLSQFGYSFFRPSAAGFAPLTDIPVGPDYVIGPGDRIILNLWGSVEGTHELEVTRSGEIVLPRVGSVKVWGITYSRLPEVIKAALGKAFKDYDLNVTMGKLRVIKVFVVGEVRAPGDYNLTPLSTLINALSAAGGPLKSGTLRNVQIKRSGKIVETVDLYDFFLKGDKSRDIRLQPGDTIFVPVIGRVAGIAGNVKRPAIYELKEEKNLDDLIGLAEGFLPTGYLQRVQISRVVAHEKNVVADFNIDPKEAGKSLEQITRSIAVQDMDIVRIFPIDTTLRGHVRLDGYVLRPGDYALQPGMRLSRLLLPDNLLQEYYRDAAEITRLYPPDYHPEIFFVEIAKAVAGDPAHDLELKEFDRVKVFSRWEMEEMPKIKVSGEVQRPGEYRLFNNMTVRDLIREAGNLKITAYTRNAEINRITRTGEKAKSFPIIVNLEEVMKGNPKDNLLLNPFDELTVRKIPNWSDEKERYVTLQGELQFPGVYPIYKGENISSIIERAGGFTDKAYPLGAKFTRRSLQEEQQKRMDEIIARTEQDILKKQGELASLASSKDELEATRASLEGLMKGLEKLKGVKAEGRLVIRLTQLDKFKNSNFDVELEGGDTLMIPRTPQSVNVLGQVYNPTSIVYAQGKNASYYLDKSGGSTRDAEESEMYIVRTDGSVISRQQNAFGFRWDDNADTWNFGTFLSTKLEPGDTLIVPQRLERIAWMREIKDITTILSQIALTAGIVVAAGL
jgi:polysaccharide biosynthesis/export protein